jgi:hypothetical protein
MLRMLNTKDAKKSFFKNDIVYNDNAKDGEGKPNTFGLMINGGPLGHISTSPQTEDERKVVSEIQYKMKILEQIEGDIKRSKDHLDKVNKKNRQSRASIMVRRVISFVKHPPTINVKNIKSYFRAQKSILGEGKVSLQVFEKRKSICRECPNRQHVDGYSDELGFCTSCGCGANPKAQLTVKLQIPKTSCPLGKWDESVGTGDTLWFRIRYILARRFSKNGLQKSTKG